MEFHDPQRFGKKRVAFRYVADPEPGTELVGQVQLLEKMTPSSSPPDLPPFAQQTSDRIKFVPVAQDTLEKLLRQPLNIVWPTVHSGNTNGKLSMYVSIDREGQIREAYPLNSDNAGLQDPVRDQLLKVQLKPASVQGQRVQMEAALTLQFSTSLEGYSGASST
jgi:hypothetical protein